MRLVQLGIVGRDGTDDYVLEDEGKVSELREAMGQQLPLFPVRVLTDLTKAFAPDNSTLVFINTRHITSLQDTVFPADAPADPDPNADPDRTVAQLKEALDGAGVEYPSDARKAELQQLATTNNV